MSVSLTGCKPSSTTDASESQPEKEVKQDRGEARPEARAGHPGYGANKKFPYIDE